MNTLTRTVTVARSSSDYTRKGEGDVIELRDGRLLLVYMEFAGDGDDYAPTRIVSMISADGGMSWGGHRVLTTTSPGDVNVFSPNLIRALDGGILLLFMRNHTLHPSLTTLHMWRSDDEGESFQPQVEFFAGQYCNLCNAVVKRLSSGRLLLPVSYPEDPVGKGSAAFNYHAIALYSDDDGHNWATSHHRVELPMRGVMEPHVEKTRDGRVVMVMRNQLGSLFLAESHDGGETWSKPQTTGLRTPESCPELTRIPETGDLLMIWNNSEYNPAFGSHYGKRSPLTAAVSTDEGRTWTHVRDIEDDPARAFSNPGCRFTSRGTAILNYWTCEYTPEWNVQDVIDLRVAVLETAWFYGG